LINAFVASTFLQPFEQPIEDRYQAIRGEAAQVGVVDMLKG
jgi:hypothetical protein